MSRAPFSRAVVGALALSASLVALPAVAAATAAPGPAAPATSERPTIQPVVDANFPDPDVLAVDGVYHAYATNSDGQNVQHRTSTDLRHWTVQPDALPELGSWTGPCRFNPGGPTDHCVWAPEVTEVDGGYAMYYAARDATTPRQCIGVALSETPEGPFEPVGDDPLVCPNGENGTTDLGGAIDASTYEEDGQRYLLWKADGNCCAGKTAIIYLQPLSDDGTALTGPPVELIRRDLPYEGRVVEAPTLVEHGGTYYLFYSANDFYGAGYRTSYATAPSLTGPYTKARTELMTTDRFQGDVRGPGGQDVVAGPHGQTSIVFHGWDPTYSYRAMYTSILAWHEGVPSVDEAAPRYQAEDGTVTHARTIDDASASGLAKVGGMDFDDSAVTVRVYADRSGPFDLGIRFANGSRDGSERVESTDTLRVNGADAGTVTFPHTTWGNWQVIEHRVQLDRGWNTVTLTRGTYFTELDSVDLYPADRIPTPSGPPADPSQAVRYEAESGVITHARVRDDASASGGKVVGGLDFDDSSVTLTIQADHAGPATLGIVFANGSERGGWRVESTDTVTVNGRDAGTVTFWPTTWGNWQTVEHQVILQPGENQVTFTHDTFYAELDAVDVY